MIYTTTSRPRPRPNSALFPRRREEEGEVLHETDWLFLTS